ncbi:hypothetical protein ACGFIJ_14275 [Microbispora bryophytorum]|uniref:hypothetical protein n=1 Tax=Microbispora bryophytorum TaxID=1460882 RepID=UPI003713D0D1
MWRYALYRSRSRTADTVLTELGGPGLAVLSGQFQLSRFPEMHKTISDRYNFLFIEEPWVTTELSDECRTSLRSFYRSVRSGDRSAPGRAEDMRVRCISGSDRTGRRAAWGFDKQSYSSLVREIEKRERIQIRGFIGASFGSVRLTYLDTADLKWAVLVRPFPVGVSGRDLLSARARAVSRFWHDVTQAASAERAGSRRDARSVPISTFDMLSAAVEFGYLDKESVSKVKREVRAGDLGPLGDLSDLLWMRYGEYDLSPAFLAYSQEVCANVSGWPSWSGRMATPSDILVAAHLPCGQKPVVHADSPFMGKLCIAFSPDDSVVPERLVRSSFADGVHAWVASDERAHGSLGGLTSCLEKVLASSR